MATKVDKKMAGTEKAAESDPILGQIHSLVKKNLIKNDVKNVYSLNEYADEFPVEHCLSTGLASLDLHMFHNSSYTQWGVPCGRWTEFSGIEGIGKTLLCHYLVADCLRRGGIAFWIQSEGEFDVEHALNIYKERGVDVSNPAELKFVVQNATSIEELYSATATVLNVVENVKAEFMKSKPDKSFRKASPPILFVVDSFAALIASHDRQGIEEKGWEKPTRMGGKAGEFHRYFQVTLNKFAELGIAGVGTNHLRANMSEYGPESFAAHDSSLKYYMSLRISFDRHPKADSKYYDALTKTFSSNMKKHVAGYPVRGTIKKIRGVKTEDGIIELPYYLGFGFDTYDTMIDGAVVNGVVRLGKGKVMTLNPTRADVSEHGLFSKLKTLDPKGIEAMYDHSTLREYLVANDEFAATFMKLIYHTGPSPRPDKRGKMKGGGGDDEE